jgi:transcriptional regulator with XRE-family HTH domain
MHRASAHAAEGAAALKHQRLRAGGTAGTLLLRRAIRRHRMARNLTLKQCADLFGIHFTQISRIESGSRLPYGAQRMSLAFAIPVTEVTASCPRCNYRPPAGFACLLCGASEQDLFTCLVCGAQAGTEVELGWHAVESHRGRGRAA